MLSVILLVINLSFAVEPSVNALKAEIVRLKQENYELQVKAGDLEAKVDEMQSVINVKPPVLVQKVPVKVKVYNRSRISVLSGVGPKNNSLDSIYLMGAQYQYMINSRISFGGQIQSNESVLLNLGLEF